jgi:acyl-CoA thioester hydrolase
MGHLNVAGYVGRFDEATWQLFAVLGLTPALLREQGRGMAAVEQRISYRREVLPGDVVLVRTELVEARARVLRFRHVMEDAVTGEVVAETELTGVHLDTSERRACALPDEVLVRAQALAGGRSRADQPPAVTGVAAGSSP